MTNLNMRRILKTPTLRMMDGGDLQVPQGFGLDRAGFLDRNPGVVQNQIDSPSFGYKPVAGAGRGLVNPAMAIPAAPTPPVAPPRVSPILRDGNSFSQAPGSQGAMPLAPKPVAPTQLTPPGVSPMAAQPAPAGGQGAAMDRKMLAASAAAPAPERAPVQFKDGSGAGYQNGLGGVVPGPARGDKFKALYEGGERVVSNDVQKDNPGLAQQLDSLRAETLARRGKTVAEADAKAVGGETLRAAGGFSGAMADALEKNPSWGAGREEFVRTNTPGWTAETAAKNPAPVFERPALPSKMLRASELDLRNNTMPQPMPAASVAADTLAGNRNAAKLNTLRDASNAAMSAPGRVTSPPAAPTQAPTPHPTITQMNQPGVGFRNAQYAERVANEVEHAARDERLTRAANPRSMTVKELFSRGDGSSRGPNAMKFAPAVPQTAANVAANIAASAPPAPTPVVPTVAPEAPKPTGVWNGVKGAAGSALNTLRDVGPSILAGIGGTAAARYARDIGNPAGEASGNYSPGEATKIPTAGYGVAPAAQPHNFFSDTDVGRNVATNLGALAAIPGGGAMAAGLKALPRTAGAASAVERLAIPAVQGAAADVRAGREEATAALAAQTAQRPANPSPTATGLPAMDANMPGPNPNRITLRGRAGADVAGAAGVQKFVENGKTLYTNVAGDNKDMMDKKMVGIVPGMSKETIDRTLTNPDGSRWSAGDNATMAANLRDGIDRYAGTSRGSAQGSGYSVIGDGGGYGILSKEYEAKRSEGMSRTSQISDLMRQGLSARQAAAHIAQLGQTDATRDGNRLQADTSLRTNADTNRTSLANNESSNRVSRENNAATNQTALRGHELDYDAKLAPIKQAKANQDLLRNLAQHPEMRGGDPALMASALTSAGRGDLAKQFSEQAAASVALAKGTEDLEAGKAKRMSEQFKGDFGHLPKEEREYAEGLAAQTLAKFNSGAIVGATKGQDMKQQALLHTKALLGMQAKAKLRNNGMWNGWVGGDDSMPTSLDGSVAPESVSKLRGALTGHNLVAGDYRYGDQELPSDVGDDVISYLRQYNGAYSAAQKKAK